MRFAGGGSSSRHHTALLRRLCGVTRILPLRGRSRYMSPPHGTIGSSSRHPTAAAPCGDLPSSCPFGAARGICLLLRAPQAPPHGTPRRLRLVGIYQALAPSGLLKVYVSSSRHHTALLRRLCGVTRILPLRGCSRKVLSLMSKVLSFRPRLFPHFAFVRGDIGEDLPLREEQDGGEHCAHHIGDGAGGPDAREPVQSGIGEQHWHDVG